MTRGVRRVSSSFSISRTGLRSIEDRLKRLEEQARQDSRTSSKPPSQDPPKTRAQRRAEARAKAKELMRREGERRKAGGQPGHRGAGRELQPEDQVDEIVDHYPDACGGCGREFDDRAAPAEAAVRSPPGRRAAADQRDLDRASHAPVALSALPRADQRPVARARSAASAFGPRLQAAVVTLTARHRISRRGICRARPRSVRRHALDRRGRRDLPARLRRVGRPALPVAGLGA